MRFAIVFFIFFSILYARYSAVAQKQCSAFNNMKHTRNSDNVTLKRGKIYRVLDSRKGQLLILVKGEKIAQRWVDEDCLKSKNSNLSQKNNSSLLSLSWQNSFCQYHKKKKECKVSLFTNSNRYSNRLVLHGLWPQPKSNQYCNMDRRSIGMDKHKQWRRLTLKKLSDDTREILEDVMPGVKSALHKHEWVKHGSCYADDAEQYFHDAATLAKQIDSSLVGRLFRRKIGKRLNLHQIREAFDVAFGKGASKSVGLKCKVGLITELRIYLSSHGDKIEDLIGKISAKKNNCSGGIVDDAGYAK